MNKVFKSSKAALVALFRNGIHEYFLNQKEYPIDLIQKIYESTEADFYIKWDLYYLSLTLENKKFKSLTRLFLFILEYARHFIVVCKEINYIYDIEYAASEGFLEARFCFSERDDLYMHSNRNYMKIYRKQGLDIINSLNAIIPCFSFKKLFYKKILWDMRKYAQCNFPPKIAVLEGKGSHARSLLLAAKKKYIQTKVIWEKAKLHCYSHEKLLNKDNLDYPMHLERPDIIDNSIILQSKKIILKNNTLIVMPSFNLAEDTMQWLENSLEIIEADHIGISIHPTYKHILKSFNQFHLNLLDNHKAMYFDNYDNFVGMHSTLLEKARLNGKVALSLCFDKISLGHANAQLSGMNIHYVEKKISK